MILGVSDVIEGSLPAKAGELFGCFCARRTKPASPRSICEKLYHYIGVHTTLLL
jgi:hypothetical protein